jgi:homoserine kinase
MRVRAYAPASIGNFAAGFDLIGAALAPLDGSLWGDVVSAETAREPSLTVSGPHAAVLPTDPWKNLVMRTYGLYREELRQRRIEVPAVAFHLEKNLPRCSGLGSSASSVAATLAACQGLLGEPLSMPEVWGLAGRAEALVSGAPHLDNVVPCLCGGLRLLVPGRDGIPEVRALRWPDDLVLVVASPAFELSTEKSRKALPRTFDLHATVEFAGNLAGFVHALAAGDRELIRRCLRDPLAEPYRASLVPGFHAAQAAAFAAGAWGCTLSGSGPALFAVADSADAGRAVAAALQGAFRDAGLDSTVRLCGLDREGARVLA